jgi:hypothetical protein
MLDQDVQSRVDAYRGNPQALQQKYSVSKDLLDLMALQKLTKEKESAARELQMAMAAQQGQGAGTIRDQLQQKALGMTKMELEKQQIGVLQQKQQQQQQNLQQIAQSGIAQNPAPNMEAAPGFASGGIIAFAGGTEVPEPEATKALRKKMQEAGYSEQTIEKAIREGATGQGMNLTPNPIRMTPGPMNPAQPDPAKILQGFTQISPAQTSPVATPAVRQDVPTEAPINVSSGASGFPMTAAPGIPSALPQREERFVAPTVERKSRPAASAVAPVGIATPPVAPAAGPVQAVAGSPPPEPATAGLAALPATAPAQAATGLTGIPLGNQRDESGALLPPEDSTIAAVAARKIMSTLNGTENPKTAAQEIREAFKSEYALTEDEKKDRQQYRESLRARHAALSDPEELRRERLKQTLLGMAGASNAGIALARGAAAGQNYEAGRNAEALKVLGDLNDIGEKEISARRAGALRGFELGGEEGRNVRTSSTAAQGQAMNALVNLMGYDAQDKRSDKELASREKTAAAEITARKDISNWDNQTKVSVVNATNAMHRDVQAMVGKVQKEVADIHGKYQLQSSGIQAGSAANTANIQRTTQLEKAIIDNRARLVNIEETAIRAIDAAAAKERTAITTLIPSTGPNAEQKKRLEAIDSGAEALKADLRLRMSQQVSDLGLENILGPNLVGSGRKKGQGEYTVTREK